MIGRRNLLPEQDWEFEEGGLLRAIITDDWSDWSKEPNNLNQVFLLDGGIYTDFFENTEKICCIQI